MLTHLIIVLVVFGLVLWLVDFLPIDAQIKRIVRILVVVVAILYALGLVGGLGPVGWRGLP